VTEPAPVVLIDPDDPADELARRLLERYGPRADKPEDKTLTQKDIGLDNRTFALLDANKDGKLDKGELAGFARRPPDLELTVRLSAKGQPAEVELNGKKGESPLDANVKARDGGVSLDLGVVNVQVRPGPEAVRPHGLEQVHLRVVGDTMDRLDTGKKGYLDEADVRNNGFLRGAFKMIDRDGDGKVTEKELRAFYQQTGDLQARASACCVSLVFIDEGRGLFDLLDADGDGRLSVRELRQAPKLLDRLDKEGKGYVARSDVPGAWRLLVRRGAAGGIGFSGFGTFGGGGNLAVEAVPPPAKEPTAGPLWFRMMDRNGDGYVSRREFLGSDELFQKIDLDGDGLISVEEAIKADALFRKGK